LHELRFAMWYCWGVKSPGMWHCIIGCMVFDVWKDHKIKRSKKNHSLWANNPWIWWHYSVIQQNSVMPSEPSWYLPLPPGCCTSVMLQTFTRPANKITIAVMPPHRDWTEKNWTPIGLTCELQNYKCYTIYW